MPLPLSPVDESADRAAEPAVILRGTRSGLEIVVAESATVDQIGADLTTRLEQSPGFFAGNDVAVRIEGRLPPGALARLEEVTGRFELRIVEVGPPRPAAPGPGESDGQCSEGEAVEVVDTAEGSAPQEAASAGETEPMAGVTGELAGLDSELELPIDVEEMDAPPAAAEVGPRLLVGPIRSGVVLEATTDLVILGDVNPGAEIHSTGNIIVLGRLRGVAHAAVGGERGFILALKLEPQQLRVGTLVARAGDADSAPEGAEIAYATGRTIVVERYQGRLPSGLSAASA